MKKSNQLPDFDNKKILCLAETNYQIINCLNVACHAKNAIFDLYVNELYRSSAQLVKRLNSLVVFDKVQMYNVKYNKAFKVLRFLFLKDYIFKIFGAFDYDVVLFASRDFVSRCVITYVKYFKPETLLISYDEGLGTYTSLMECYTNIVEKTLIKVLYNDDANIITDKLLYEPDAYCGNAENIKLYKIPKINSKIVYMCNRLFQFDKKMQINDKYIFFDQYFDENDETLQKVIEILVRKTGNQLMIKKHPQTPDGNFSIGHIYEYPNIPYEIIAANDDNIENKVLITSFSTAVWTPMLLFKKFPKIILLYPIFGKKNIDAVITKFIDMYDRNKVFIINTYDELEKLNLRNH